MRPPVEPARRGFGKSHHFEISLAFAAGRIDVAGVVLHRCSLISFVPLHFAPPSFAGAPPVREAPGGLLQPRRPLEVLRSDGKGSGKASHESSAGCACRADPQHGFGSRRGGYVFSEAFQRASRSVGDSTRVYRPIQQPTCRARRAAFGLDRFASLTRVATRRTECDPTSAGSSPNQRTRSLRSSRRRLRSRISP